MLDKKNFMAAALALGKKAFVVYVAYLEAKISIYSAWKAQMALLLAKKVSVPKEHPDFLNIFSKICSSTF